MNIEQLKLQLNSALKNGLERFGLTIGIVSYIHGKNYKIIAVSSETGGPRVGEEFELANVYCSEVFEKKKTIAITQVDGIQGMSAQPLYHFFPCEAYISSPIWLNDKVWGTLNFTSFDKRATSFSGDDIAFNEALAIEVAQAINECDLVSEILASHFAH